MDYILILSAVCFVLLFIIIFLLSGVNTCTTQMINGFWIVSEQFKEEAKIDQLLIYFDEGSGYDYNGYMVMVIDGKTVFNDSMKFKISPKGYLKSDCYKIIMEKDTKMMPLNMTMEICPCTGSMELKSLGDNKIYGRLYKNNQLSAKTLIKIKDTPSKALNISAATSDSEEL